MKDKTQKTTWP